MPHRRLPLLASLLLAVTIGCASSRTGTTVISDPAPPPVADFPDTVTTLGNSVNGVPLMLYTFNASGPRPVLILAAIHGDEPTTAYCANQLIAVLRATPSMAEGIPVAILPVANPDGLAAHTRTNARGVDLNRNFPASNFVGRAGAVTRPRNNPGAEAGSEPETQILIRLIERLNPRRICSIHSIGQGRQQNNYDGPARGLAEMMARYNHYPASPNIGYPTPGSFGTWAGIDRGIPVITLELPSRTPGPQAWAENRGALLAFVRGR